MKEVIISGVGKYIPSKVVTNEMLSDFIDTSDEWISTRTGIKTRYITTGEDTSDIASKAALQAIENSKINVLDIGLIIVATSTPDTFMPSTACIVQKNIGAKNAYSFDLSAACSGFIYILDTAKCIMKEKNIKNALIIGAEAMSKALNWSDRTTCVLFGDGAGAVVLSLSKEEGIIDTICKTKSDKWECLTIGAKEVKNPYIDENEKIKNSSKGYYLEMEGSEIFKFATSTINKLIKEILQNNNIDLEDIRYIIPHQANERIIKISAKKLNIDIEKFFINISNYGNTSAASIPIAIQEMDQKGLLKKGDNIIIVGFGAGLTSGVSLIKWQK